MCVGIDAIPIVKSSCAIVLIRPNVTANSREIAIVHLADSAFGAVTNFNGRVPCLKLTK